MQYISSILHCSRHFVHNLAKETLLNHLSPPQLLHCSGALTDAEKVFKNKKIIGYYFSASWCNPCKVLLPKIKGIYKESKDKKYGLEIIYISSDTEEDKMINYFKERHGGWYAIPFNSPAAEAMRQIFNVSHVPQIIVVKDDGTIISRTGVRDIEKLGLNVLVAWNSEEPK